MPVLVIILYWLLTTYALLQQLAADKAELESQIASLQASIATYKGEYADAIREIESVKVSVCLIII
jgi:cell division protein FtsB